MLNKVIVLYNGYSKETEDPNIMRCNCSCSLIITKNNQYIIVDTMTPWDTERLVTALKQHNLSGGDISHLICTHVHSDHVGNNNLFLNAKHIVGQCVSQQDRFEAHDFLEKPYLITDDIEVMATPGHTTGCVSVVVRNCAEGTIVIAGDLFEKSEDIDDSNIWLNAGSENEGEQRLNRFKVAEIADIIVPGHGPKFAITDEIRKKLKEDKD